MLSHRGGGGWAYVGYLITNCIPTLGNFGPELGQFEPKRLLLI
jgi:hypothetical protein